LRETGWSIVRFVDKLGLLCVESRPRGWWRP